MQGVDYPATANGVVIGSTNPSQAEGAKKSSFPFHPVVFGWKVFEEDVMLISCEVVQLVKQAQSKCPSSKIILAGYSQGAQQVHGAMIGLSDGEVDVGVSTFFFPSYLANNS